MTRLMLMPATASTAQLIAAVEARRTPAMQYNVNDVQLIINLYASIAQRGGLNPVIAVAQMLHETGHMSSFWSARPQRNPAGIGVTGLARTDWPAPEIAHEIIDSGGKRWSYNTQRQRWEVGLRFATWIDAITAHVGRLVAYATTDEAANDQQRQLIGLALRVRSLPERLRGQGQTVEAMARHWAADVRYAERIMAMVVALEAQRA